MSATDAPEPIVRSFRAMNTACRFVSYRTSGIGETGAERALDEAEAMVYAIEERFSRFRDSSELSRINARTGDWITISRDMAEVVGLAVEFHKETHGIFDPSIVDSLEYAGYRGSFETIVSQGPPITGSAPGRQNFAGIEFREGNCLRLPTGLRLDLGGIVKGWAADRLANHLGALGPALVDLGGDIAVRGMPPGDSGWLIGVENVDREGDYLAMLQVDAGGVATSGTNRRRWKRGDQWLHHLIDPRTGRPAQTDLCQAVALAESTVRAEVCAKTALIMGSRECERLLRDQADLGLLLVARDGTATASPRVLRSLAGVAVEGSRDKRE